MNASKWVRNSIIGAGLALAVGLGAMSAFAGTQATSTAKVQIAATMALSGLTASFTLAGNPGAAVTVPNAVSFNVATNGATGYSASMLANFATLSGTGSNTATIPVGSLSYVTKVNGSTTGGFSGALSTTPTKIATVNGATSGSGDNDTQDWSITVPNLPADTYSTTLDYAVAAN